MSIFVIVGIIICLILCYVVWQYFELKRFSVTEYNVSSDKIEGQHQMVVLADLHGFEYGRNNEKLLDAIKKYQPEIILIAGDMIVSSEPETFRKSLIILEQLVAIAPVCYGFGNHESKAPGKGIQIKTEFEDYLHQVKKLGVKILSNENSFINLRGENFRIAGAEIDLNFYTKKKIVSMDYNYMETLLGPASCDEFQILLAHNPMYCNQYSSWGADLTLCGHNHGGLIRFPWGGCFMSPQFTFFPKYNDGLYDVNGKKTIVSRGLGTHTLHIRVFNRAELVVVRLFSNSLEKKSFN